MFRSPFIRVILLVSISAIILFPLYTVLIQHPAFTKLLAENTTREAERIASTLSSLLATDGGELTADALPTGFRRYVTVLQQDSRIMKLKIFSPYGTIIYSTDPLEIGRINEEDYFQHIIETKDRRSQLVDKNARSFEKQVVPADVVETYAPIVNDKRLIGVLEIYYDITPEKEKLHHLLDRITGTLLSLAVILLLAVFLAADKTWNAMQERKRAEDALAESEKRYRTLFENAADAIFILEGEGDGTGRIIAANKAAVSMHGYSLEELMTMRISDLDNEPSAEKAPDLFRRIGSGEWIKTEIEHRRKNGTTFPIEIGAGLLDLGGHRYILVFDRDITTRREVETGREKLIADLREALDKIRTLKGLLPICSSCKKIRDDKGYWNQIEAYISAHTDADFSHGICPECAARLYPEISSQKRNDENSI